MEKTHWLQSPNKNYLGHWDLPETNDLVLTIKSAQWEEVKNPITNKTEAKRVIRFEENVKPLICNQTNAQAIINSTKIKYMEDSQGCKIQLYIGQHLDRRTKENVDCIRVRNKFDGGQEALYKETSEMFAEKQHLLNEAQYNRAHEILTKKLDSEYSRLLKHLKSLS